MAGVREYWREISKEKKLFSIFSVSILLFCVGYVGIGYVVAQSLAVNPGCGMWSENSPSDWDVDDDWESFDP